MDVELAAAETLLDRGVSVPFREVRIPFTKLVWQLRLTMRRPRLGGQIRIARHYLKLGVTWEQIVAFTPDEERVFVAMHGRRLSRMIALTVCRGFVSGRLLAPIVALLIRELVDARFIVGAQRTYLSLLGTRSFLIIIDSARRLNPMTPSQSRKAEGS